MNRAKRKEACAMTVLKAIEDSPQQATGNLHREEDN